MEHENAESEVVLEDTTTRFRKQDSKVECHGGVAALTNHQNKHADRHKRAFFPSMRTLNTSNIPRIVTVGLRIMSLNLRTVYPSELLSVRSTLLFSDLPSYGSLSPCDCNYKDKEKPTDSECLETNYNATNLSNIASRQRPADKDERNIGNRPYGGGYRPLNAKKGST